VAVLDDQREGAQLIGLVARRHGQIGMILPIAEHARALEVTALQASICFCAYFAARSAKRLGVDFLTHAAVRFLHLHLDRQAVAIPTGHVRGVVAIQGARLDDHVLENLVDRVTQVQRAVGIRRPVGQHVTRAALAGALRIFSYRPSVSHASSIAGSRLARSAFIGKPVLGKLIVDL
jgi:hypothetical protein